MIKTKEVVIPAKPEKHEQKIVEILCDLCRRSTPHNDWQEPNWDPFGSNINETSVSRCTGCNFGTDGGELEFEFFHICPDCWPKLVAWFREQHVTPGKKERNW